jgi:hypothetical protein
LSLHAWTGGLLATMGWIADMRRDSLPEGTYSAADGKVAGACNDRVRPEAFGGRRCAAHTMADMAAVNDGADK